MDTKDRNINAEIGDNLLNFLSDTEGLTDEEIDDELLKYNVNISSLTTKVQSMVSVKLDSERLAWQKDASITRDKELNKLQNLKFKLINLSRNELLAEFQQMLNGIAPKLSLEFRELDPTQLDDNELQNIIVELIHLENNVDEDGE